jgi:thioredoxin reductase (NADPH)
VRGARGDRDVFEISGEALRHVLNQCPGLSDIILQTFIARWQLFGDSPNFIGLRVIGSRYSPDTFQVRDFLARNRVHYLD